MRPEMYIQGNLVQKQFVEIIEIETDLEVNEEFYVCLNYSYE